MRARESWIVMADGCGPTAGRSWRLPPESSTRRPFLDPLLVACALDDVAHEDAGRDDVVGIDFAGLDQLFDLGNRRRGGGGHDRVEVARRAAVDQVAGGVAAP